MGLNFEKIAFTQMYNQDNRLAEMRMFECRFSSDLA
jgi:hypothetical protein